MNLGLWRYIKEAFNAKYLGMFISPAWMIIPPFAFLGLTINPGFFLIGLGLELTYVSTIATHPRFQRYVDNKVRSRLVVEENLVWDQRTEKLISQLERDDKERFNNLKTRCDLIINFYSTQLSLSLDILQQHTQSLNKLVWIFLQLLVTKQAVMNLMQENTINTDFEGKIQNLETQINTTGVSEDLKKSLESSRDILKLRLQTLTEAKEKLAYVDAELDRIEQQVELIREQAIVSKDSQVIANRIDLVSSSLSQTGEWIKEQESVMGAVDHMLEGSPNILSKKTLNLENQ